VREEAQKKSRRRGPREQKAAAAKEPQLPKPKASEEERRQEAIDLVMETIEAVQAERGEQERVWGSVVKQALKRRKPGFRESYYGFESFTDLLEEMQRRGLLTLVHDERSGGYLIETRRA